MSPQDLTDSEPPYDTVIFDCDSTLSAMEGIEALVGENEELAELTAAAMAGSVPLEQVYGRRLEIAQPTSSDMGRVGDLYVEFALPNARNLVQALQLLGKRVVIVSGGLLPPVLQFGAWLGIDSKDIEAVDLSFDAEGHYVDYDRNSPLARAGGKIEVLSRLLRESSLGQMAFIGDGATDLEAAHLAQRFIAYGGVERREAVTAGALVHCDEPDFSALAPLLFSTAELEQLSSHPTHRTLLAGGDR